MKLHWFQHVQFEGLGCIERWALAHGHSLSATRFHARDILPAPTGIDMLIVMGGPMGANDEREYQ